ncbi:protein kintoun-like [Patiria miniata]|uniref:Protein kintoun n=1 Tax=Patiria miniata TaxID=46514 RepID=A0A914B8A2_PATMI|nr:protein kintoun-like [Patiria miniata]
MASSGDLDVTPEEVERISKALKDEKFRQLFFEYAQEISDPENRKKYEEEISQLEKNRGTDVVFVHPEPGYVIKTNVNGEQKAFINVCRSDKVAKPTATDVRRDNGEVGTQWSVPHSLAPAREDLDKGGGNCMVYDCVFHPDCFQAAEKDKRFVKLMDDTVLDSIESNLGVKLDRSNVKKLTKLKFKGQPRPTVIRTKSKTGPSGETDALKDFNIDYPYKGVDESQKGESNPPAKSATKISGSRNATSKKDPSGPIEPKYSIIHRGHFDMQHFTNAPDSMPTTRPQELVLKIQLPLLKSIATVQLDVFQKQVVLECQKPASYKLDLVLPYPVDEEKGAAKFDKSKSCLTITLPVLPPEIPKLPTFAPEPQNVSLVEEIQQNGDLDQAPSETSVEGEVKSKTTNHEGDSPNEEGPSNSVDESRTCSRSEAANDKEGTQNQNRQDVQPSQEEGTPQQNGIEESRESTSSDDIHSVASQNVPTKMESDAEQCPDYTFRQDDETASFILQVAKIDADNLHKQISDDKTTVSLKFQSKFIVNGETVTLPYSLCVVFEPQCQLEGMEMDVQQTEAVLLLHKASASRGEWSQFKAGPSLSDLEAKLFLTEENVREHLSDMTRKHRGKRARSAGNSGMDCGVIEASNNKLVIELEAKTNGDVGREDEVADAALGTVTDTVVDAVIGELSTTAASLKLDLQHGDSSPGSDTSSPSTPSTPCSPSGLRSALKDGNHSHRTQRSVSFSEDVVVETMVRSSPCKTKGKNNRHQPPRPRRFITKLRDTSQNQSTCSDSEVHYRGGAKGRQQEEEDEDEEFLEEVVFPEWVCVDRQTSSDSSGGESTAVVQDSSKKKKPKANKRQRKKMNAAKKAMAFDDDNGGMKEAWFEPRHPLRTASSEGSLPASISHTEDKSGDPAVAQKKHHKQPPKKDQIKNLAQPEVESIQQEEKSQNDSAKDEMVPLDQVDYPAQPEAESMKQEDKSQNDGEKDEEVPLELQDHRTQSAVTLSNEVMFELDD